jgi:hypothetical protein
MKEFGSVGNHRMIKGRSAKDGPAFFLNTSNKRQSEVVIKLTNM